MQCSYNGEVDSRRYLRRNVMRGRLVVSKHLKCVRSVTPKLSSHLNVIEKRMMTQNGLTNLFSVEYTCVEKWSTPADFENLTTNCVTVQSYVLFVDVDENVKIIETGLSVVPLQTNKRCKVFNTKKGTKVVPKNVKTVNIASEDVDNTQAIYYAVIVKRLTAATSNKRASRGCVVVDKTKTNPTTSLRQLLAVGCRQVFLKDRFNFMDGGLSKMMLMQSHECPDLEIDVNDEWMNNFENLKTLNELDLKTKTFHPQIIFSSFSKNRNNVLKVAPPPVITKMKDSHRQQGDFGRKRLENQANVQSTKFRELAKNGHWFESVEHDIEDVYCGYRRRADRSIALKKNKKSKVMERSQRSDDSHCIHHERIVYEPRGNLELLPPLKPIDSAKELEYPNKEVYAMNNAKLFSQLNSQEKYPYSLTDVAKNMDVIKVPTTEAFKKYFDWKLANPTIPKTKKKKYGRRQRKQIVQEVRSVPRRQIPVPDLQANPPEGEFGRDADGRLIPTFSELFFSYEKTENYNNLIRDYLSMAGIGHAGYSADFKCRILIGFITKNFKIVFDNKLGDIFEKHLQLMGIFCTDWKKEHFQVVREKFLQLKNEWKEQNNQ